LKYFGVCEQAGEIVAQLKSGGTGAARLRGGTNLSLKKRVVRDKDLVKEPAHISKEENVTKESGPAQKKKKARNSKKTRSMSEGLRLVPLEKELG